MWRSEWPIAGLGLLLGCGDEPSRPPPPSPRAPPSLSAIEARTIFCERVFDLPSVGLIVGVNRFDALRSTRPLEPGVGECIYLADDDASTALVVDCRPEHPRLEPTRAASAASTGFREVDVGIGGIYTIDPIGPVHRLVFFTERPAACTVYLSTTGIADDTTEALARHVVQRITPPPSTP
jgi:hypothetical protein